MAWSAITSVVTYSAGNAIPVTNTGAEPISVTVKRPASGADVIVTFYADGAPVHTMTTSATDPIKTSAFSAPGATSLNYSTDRAFASPGASISASTEASTPSSTPSGDVAVAGAVVASNTGVQRHRATWYQNLFPDNQLSVWSAPGTRTILLRIPAPCAFGGFRLRIPSGGNDAVQYSCAVNGAELDNGSTWTWTQIPIGGSTAAYTRAAAGGTEWTDWMFMPSVPRLDGSSRPYLFVRCYGAASVYKAFSVQSAVCQKQQALYGADALAYAAVGDNRLTSLGMTPTYSTSVQLNILGVEWTPVDDKPAYTIGCTGDSIDQGWDRSGGTNLLWQPAAEEACRELIRRGKRCIDFSLPRAGQNHTAAMGDITTLLAQFVPDFHLFSPWSANDTDSEQAFRDCWGRTMAGIKTLQAAGVTPVVRTLHPRGATGPAELRRTALNDMVRLLRGVIVVDLDAALRDPSNPSVMLPGYEDPAGIDAHLSKAGTARYGVAVADAIEGWIG